MKLLAIDGYNIVRRIYGANPAPDSEKKAIGAVKASLQSINRALVDHQPTHALIAFDAGGNTWRHEIYPAYKSSRKPMPDVLRNAMPGLIEQLETWGFCVKQIPGVEAEDTLASLVKKAEAKGIPSTVLSNDKDVTSLIGPLIKIHDHFERVERDAAWLLAKIGIRPDQVVDYLALMGDATDDVPGVPGIGAKTATKLLIAHGTLLELLDASVVAADAGNKVARKLVEHRESALLSQQLTRLKMDVEIGVASWSELRCPMPA